MKKYVLSYFLILLVTGSSLALPKRKLTASPQSVIYAYMEAFKNGDAKIINEILHDDACIKMPRQSTILKHTKKQLVGFYKKEKYNQMNCETNFEILSNCDAVVVAIVDFKFANFTQRNFVTIEKMSNDEWRVMGANRFFI